MLKSLLTPGCAAAVLLTATPALAAQPPRYSINKLLVPEYQLDVPFEVAAPIGFNKTPKAGPVYKPHEVAIDSQRRLWVSSNERGEPGNELFRADGTRLGEYRAGISVFNTGSNKVLAKVIIDEPVWAPGALAADPNSGPVSEPYASSTGFLYHGMELEGTPVPPEDDDEHSGAECPERPADALAFVQTVMLPVVLPANSRYDVNAHSFPDDPLGRKDYDGHTLKVVDTDASGRLVLAGHDAFGRPAVMSPMGAECHSRHPHGIDIDKKNNLVYLLIEHGGLRWNQNRTDLAPAATTDEESGSGLVFDISDPGRPKILTGYLFGHGAHELAVNDNNGFVFQGNHENSPGVSPPNWTDVIDPAQGMDGQGFPYGFIDTGFYQALQDIEMDETTNTVYNVSHVGERLYAFDGSCKPTLNPAPSYGGDNPATPEVESYLEKQYGDNCVKYWVDLRKPFDKFYGTVATQIFSTIDQEVPSECLPAVLHYHNLGLDPVNQKVYNGLHSIHHAEHTGLPWEEECPESVEDPITEDEPLHHYNGRSVTAVDVNPRHFRVDPVTKEAKPSKPRWKPTVIDVSNGYGYIEYPNIEDVVGDPQNEAEAIEAVDRLENSFVHPHWLGVDPRHDALLISSEHTGNVGVVNINNDELVQVLPVALFNPGLQLSLSSDCEVEVDELTGEPTGVPDDLEPHLHGLQIDPRTGAVYLSYEEEHCFYGYVMILNP